MQNILYHGVICVLKLSCHIYQTKNYCFYFYLRDRGTARKREKGRERDWGRQRDRKPSIWSFTSQISATAGLGLSCHQILRLRFRSSTWVEAVQLLGPSFPSLKTCIGRKLLFQGGARSQTQTFWCTTWASKPLAQMFIA